jgi:hypothetical protein
MHIRVKWLLSMLVSLFLIWSSPLQAAWLLWEHWSEHRHPLPQEQDEKGLTKGFRRTSDTWSLNDALDTRDQCVARLNKRLGRIREVTQWGEQDSKPNERTKFKEVPNDTREINREMYMFQDLRKSDGTQERSSVLVSVWCLPVGVDPKTIGDR